MGWESPPSRYLGTAKNLFAKKNKLPPHPLGRDDGRSKLSGRHVRPKPPLVNGGHPTATRPLHVGATRPSLCLKHLSAPTSGKLHNPRGEEAPSPLTRASSCAVEKIPLVDDDGR